MYEVPASYHKAHIHEQAYKFGLNTISTDPSHRGTKCECCDHFIAYEELNLCHAVEIEPQSEVRNSHIAKSKKVQLPLGLSLYFSFIKRIIGYFVLRFLVFDLYNLYISMYGDYCSNILKSSSTDLCTITYSGYNLKGTKHLQGTNVLDLLNFIFTLLAIIYFILFKRFQEEQKNAARL